MNYYGQHPPKGMKTMAKLNASKKTQERFNVDKKTGIAHIKPKTKQKSLTFYYVQCGIIIFTILCILKYGFHLWS